MSNWYKIPSGFRSHPDPDPKIPIPNFFGTGNGIHFWHFRYRYGIGKIPNFTLKILIPYRHISVSVPSLHKIRDRYFLGSGRYRYFLIPS
ncbi:hypothetical protein HanRHA438_Chr15g0734361 [Helianthus annuus]|nr:hypothetical protein HanRHA438_Chr15g0734361 [Helianthus annuus]